MRRALAAVATVGCGAALVLGGCSDPSEEEQLVEALQDDFGLEQEQAECVANQLFERFSDDEIATLREADGRDDLSEEQLAQLRVALTPCAGS